MSDCTRRTDTVAEAAIRLPAAAWGEKAGTVTNSERRISRQRAFRVPPDESRPDWWMICEVARRMGFGDAFDYRGPADIFREHARLSAFENRGTRAFDIGALADVDDEIAEHRAALEQIEQPIDVLRRPARQRSPGRARHDPVRRLDVKGLLDIDGEAPDRSWPDRLPGGWQQRRHLHCR